jgi:hypothetical protein
VGDTTIRIWRKGPNPYEGRKRVAPVGTTLVLSCEFLSAAFLADEGLPSAIQAAGEASTGLAST